MTILLFLQSAAAQSTPAQWEAVSGSIAFILATIAIALSKGYLTKQFSGVNEKINGVKGELSGLRVDMAVMDGRIKSIPADTALQIAESYEKGSKVSRESFVAIGTCGQRQKDVDRRLDGIESVARTAAHDADEAGFRIRGLEHGGGD